MGKTRQQSKIETGRFRWTRGIGKQEHHEKEKKNPKVHCEDN